MAATLPPIKSPSGSKQGYAVPAPKGPPSGKLKPLRKIGKTDREILFKQEVLRQQQPDLSKKQTSRYIINIRVNLLIYALSFFCDNLKFQLGIHKMNLQMTMSFNFSNI